MLPQGETKIDLVGTCEEFEGYLGKRPSESCVRDWFRRGVAGVRLEGVRVGRHFASSKEAVARFVKKTSRAEAAA